MKVKDEAFPMKLKPFISLFKLLSITSYAFSKLFKLPKLVSLVFLTINTSPNYFIDFHRYLIL